MTMETRIGFTASGLRLEGKLYAPEPAGRGAVLCHPHPQYGGTMDNNVVVACARALQEVGFATLRFNFRGVGASEGAYGDLVGEIEDARAASQCAKGELPHARLSLIGYSFGALVALRAGFQDPAVDRLVAIAPPVAMYDLSFLGGCEKPVLYVAGDRDSFCPEDALESRADSLGSRHQIVRLKGVDHFFFGSEARLSAGVTSFLTA